MATTDVCLGGHVLHEDHGYKAFFVVANDSFARVSGFSKFGQSDLCNARFVMSMNNNEGPPVSPFLRVSCKALFCSLRRQMYVRW